mgnify:CR=1 FL=1
MGSLDERWDKDKNPLQPVKNKELWQSNHVLR